MKLPRDISYDELLKILKKRLDYEAVRQRGSHIRVRTFRDGEHYLTIPAHSPVKTGTLRSIIRDVCKNHGLDLSEVLTFLE